MVKIKNRRKLGECFGKYDEGKINQINAAKYLEITTRRFRQIRKEYEKTGVLPEIGIKLGRPKKDIPKGWKGIIGQEYKKDRLNALYLEKTIYVRYKIRMPHNTIQKVLLELDFAKREKNKQNKRIPWIRYERKHSLSAVHTDWHESKVNGKQVCAVLDDASRKTLAAGEFDNATAENSIAIMKEAYEKNEALYQILSAITDHGTQFYVNLRNKEGLAYHEFEKFLTEHNIRHILCGVNHPQTNGKQEKWNDFYEKHRARFNSIDELVEWYNNRPHGALNLRRAETPNQAFVRKMRPEVWLGLSMRIFERDTYENG